MSKTVDEDMTDPETQIALHCVGGHHLTRARYDVGPNDSGVAIAVGCEKCNTSFGVHTVKEPIAAEVPADD
jgi:hypothetical protein